MFKGTTIARFEVEVVTVLKNFNPQHDIVLVRCSGANLEHTGPVSGMSGSPIYLKDGSGRDRLLGAFAYGWAMTKDPVAGVQPIEYMLELPRDPKPAGDLAGTARKDAKPLRSTAQEPSGQVRWSMIDLPSSSTRIRSSVTLTTTAYHWPFL